MTLRRLRPRRPHPDLAEATREVIVLDTAVEQRVVSVAPDRRRGRGVALRRPSIHVVRGQSFSGQKEEDDMINPIAGFAALTFALAIAVAPAARSRKSAMATRDARPSADSRSRRS